MRRLPPAFEPPLPRRLYVAGAMSRHRDLNHSAFYAAATQLLEAGLAVVNPAAISPAGTEWGLCMRADIRELMLCDGVALLDQDWEESAGAPREVAIALSLGMPVRGVSEWLAILRSAAA